MKKFLAIFFTLLVASAAVVFIWHFTDHFNSDFKTFYLVYEDENIMSSEAEIELKAQTSNSIKVKYPFETKKRDYTVSITPNPEVEFQYTVGTSIKRWKGERNVGKLFEIKQEESSFTVKSLFDADADIEKVLSLLYPGEKVDFLDDPPEEDIPLFILTVSSYNAKIKYDLEIRFVESKIASIEQSVPPGDIYF